MERSSPSPLLSSLPSQETIVVESESIAPESLETSPLVLRCSGELGSLALCAGCPFAAASGECTKGLRLATAQAQAEIQLEQRDDTEASLLGEDMTLPNLLFTAESPAETDDDDAAASKFDLKQELARVHASRVEADTRDVVTTVAAADMDINASARTNAAATATTAAVAAIAATDVVVEKASTTKTESSTSEVIITSEASGTFTPPESSDVSSVSEGVEAPTPPEPMNVPEKLLVRVETQTPERSFRDLLLDDDVDIVVGSSATASQGAPRVQDKPQVSTVAVVAREIFTQQEQPPKIPLEEMQPPAVGVVESHATPVVVAAEQKNIPQTTTELLDEARRIAKNIIVAPLREKLSQVAPLSHKQTIVGPKTETRAKAKARTKARTKTKVKTLRSVSARLSRKNSFPIFTPISTPTLNPTPPILRVAKNKLGQLAETIDDVSQNHTPPTSRKLQEPHTPETLRESQEVLDNATPVALEKTSCFVPDEQKEESQGVVTMANEVGEHVELTESPVGSSELLEQCVEFQEAAEQIEPVKLADLVDRTDSAEIADPSEPLPYLLRYLEFTDDVQRDDSRVLSATVAVGAAGSSLRNYYDTVRQIIARRALLAARQL